MSAVISSQACAACKFQRRKCAPDCPLAPYFPPDQPKQFLNVHRLFGVSNVLRILRQIDPAMKADAIKSIVYEADAWERDPVNGCLGLISILQTHVDNLRVELENARSQILLIEHSKQIGSAQPFVNPASIDSHDQMYVHPSSVAGTNQANQQDMLGGDWIYSASYGELSCIDQGSNMFGINAASHDEGRPHSSNPTDANDRCSLRVAAGGGSTPFALHEASCGHGGSSRDEYLAFQSGSLQSTSDALNTSICQTDKEDLKLAAALFSLTGHERG